MQQDNKLDSIAWFSDDVTNKLDNRSYFPLQLIESTTFVFHLFNQCLAECSFKLKILEDYQMFATMLMCQPLPYSLIPLETERIIINERLLPGITKVLRIA